MVSVNCDSPQTRYNLTRGRHQVVVSKADFKFNAAHFIAFKGYRERLHGHNYRVSVRLQGKKGPDGYVVDFGDIKKATRSVCKSLNEYFICPCKSDCLKITRAKNADGSDGNVEIECEDGSHFSFPFEDCAMLPIVHSSAEELATYVCDKIIGEISLKFLQSRGVSSIEVGVAEAKNQAAFYTVDFEMPYEENPLENLKKLPVRKCSEYAVHKCCDGCAHDGENNDKNVDEKFDGEKGENIMKVEKKATRPVSKVKESASDSDEI
eukprot:g113.t1